MGICKGDKAKLCEFCVVFFRREENEEGAQVVDIEEGLPVRIVLLENLTRIFMIKSPLN